MILDSKCARLLIVEDEMITARDLQDTLEELGYDVPEIASSGDEALDLATRVRPDLVLMDVNLGNSVRDGVEIASEMRDRLGLPVIYLTAYADPATLARASATAPLGYLTKPFDRLELHATIQMALVKFQMDEQLRQSENWYSTSLSSIGDGVIATDAAGRVKFVNPVAATLIGWTNEEAVGEMMDEVFTLFDKSTRVARPGLAARVLADKCTLFLEEGTLLRSRTGTFVPVDDSAAPIRDQRDGSVLGVVVVFRDVSEKQQAAVELERARRLESLGTLAGGLAHDLNNILCIVAGNVSQAARPGASAETQAHAFATVETALRRAKALTSQFLTFSTGGEPIRRVIDLRTLLTEEIDLVLGNVETSASLIEHRTEIAPDLWTVEADEGQIRRVLENFLRNAIQSLSTEGGCITARAANCTRESLWASPSGAYDIPEGSATHFVKLEVIDTGGGIAPENIAHVCEPYFTTRATGNGLGLSVCRSIARKHGGFLRIHSTVGEGTTVAIYLPAHAPKAAERVNSEQPALCAGHETASGSTALETTGAEASTRRILVMDDEPLMCEMLSIMLSGMGYEAVIAQTGEEALRIYAEAAATGNRFDVVFIDLVNKLGMGGEEMIKRLRQSDPQAVAVVCSGYSNHPIIANYQSYGFSGCLPKIFTMKELESTVQRMVQAGRHSLA